MQLQKHLKDVNDKFRQRCNYYQAEKERLIEEKQ